MFEHLCSSLFLSGESLVAMLTGFFDESGTHKNQDVYAPTLAVGGYVSRIEQWIKFSHEWKQVLDAEGVPFFHMKDFQVRFPGKDGNLRGASYYKDWEDERRDRVYGELCRIIHFYTLAPIFSSVVLPDYDEVVTGEYRKLLGSPYAFNTQICWRILGGWARDNQVSEPINYVFETIAGHSGEVTDFHTKTYKDEEFRDWIKLGFISPADKKTVRPLQAADIHVHQLRLRTINHLDPNQETFFSKRLRSLTQFCHQRRYMYWSKKELTNLIARIDRVGKFD